MRFNVEITERVVPMLAKLVLLLKPFNRKVLLIIGAIVVVAVSSVAGYVLGTTHGPGPSPLPAPSPSLKERVGGLDLAKYCDSYSYSQVDTEFCTSSIDLNNACNWQYKRTDLRIVLKSNDPYSGKCYDRQQRYVGGIKDMPGYCRETYQESIDVQAVVLEDRTWACRAPINKSLACGWQYQTESLAAVEESEGIWACYKP
jgi:hypothetical protein